MAELWDDKSILQLYIHVFNDKKVLYFKMSAIHLWMRTCFWPQSIYIKVFSCNLACIKITKWGNMRNNALRLTCFVAGWQVNNESNWYWIALLKSNLILIKKNAKMLTLCNRQLDNLTSCLFVEKFSSSVWCLLNWSDDTVQNERVYSQLYNLFICTYLGKDNGEGDNPFNLLLCCTTNLKWNWLGEIYLTVIVMYIALFGYGKW
jgi:hypothetical protein